jgi:hypothetical protein
MAVGPALQQVAHREDRAAEVGQHYHALATICPGDCFSDRVPARAEGAARPTARWFNANLGAGDLRSQVSQPASQLKAVRDQYNPDQISKLPGEACGPRYPVPDDSGSLHYRQEFSNAE